MNRPLVLRVGRVPFFDFQRVFQYLFPFIYVPLRAGCVQFEIFGGVFWCLFYPTSISNYHRRPAISNYTPLLPSRTPPPRSIEVNEQLFSEQNSSLCRTPLYLPLEPPLEAQKHQKHRSKSALSFKRRMKAAHSYFARVLFSKRKYEVHHKIFLGVVYVMHGKIL